eukprot:scaffold157111_cov36-Tisochrysis_lutea.AAC.5
MSEGVIWGDVGGGIGNFVPNACLVLFLLLRTTLQKWAARAADRGIAHPSNTKKAARITALFSVSIGIARAAAEASVRPRTMSFGEEERERIVNRDEPPMQATCIAQHARIDKPVWCEVRVPERHRGREFLSKREHASINLKRKAMRTVS